MSDGSPERAKRRAGRDLVIGSEPDCAYSVRVSDGSRSTTRLDPALPAARDRRRLRCRHLVAVAAVLPVPLLVVVLAGTGTVQVALSAIVVVAATLCGAVVATRCAERRMRRDVDDRALELDHTKRQILALVSHELRTPVTGVVGFSRTLSSRLDELDHETVRLFVDAIDEHSNRLARLIDNVVVASRAPLATGGASSQLSTALSAAVARVAPRTEDRRRLQISLDGALGTAIDEEAAVRILTNLIDNALKFGDPECCVHIDGRVRAGRVVLRVGNAGPAIPLGLRSALYDTFVQGDATDTRTADGLGLGLHVVRQLVEAYDGTIHLIDHPRLVVFEVTLPMASDHAGASAARRAATDDPTRSADPAGHLVS